MMSRKEQIAATYLRLCPVHVDFHVQENGSKILCDSDCGSMSCVDTLKKTNFSKVPFHTCRGKTLLKMYITLT